MCKNEKQVQLCEKRLAIGGEKGLLHGRSNGFSRISTTKEREQVNTSSFEVTLATKIYAMGVVQNENEI
jgi:hypothetical protein